MSMTSLSTTLTRGQYAPLLHRSFAAPHSNFPQSGHAVFLRRDCARVSPQDGKLDSLVLLEVNGNCIQVFLTEAASRYPTENIVMVVDGAGRHKSKSFDMPANLKLLFLPRHSPEVNPQEHIWDELREKNFYNKTFGTLDALEDLLVEALAQLETQHDTVKSIAAWEWIIHPISIAKYS